MAFYTSPSFFIFLAALIAPAAALGLTGHRIKRYGMAASALMLAFLFSGSVRGLLAFLGFTAVATACAFTTLASWKRGTRSLVLYRVCLACTIAPLVTYKIGGVWHADVLGFVGISYLTFRAVQVLIEIRDGLIADLRPLDYLYFLTFFAQVTSGPIDRSRRFMADADAVPSRAGYADLLSRGIMLLLVGAVSQLVLATMLRSLYDPSAAAVRAGVPTIANLGLPAFWAAVVRAYAYGAYLFFDFAGYSLMAMGASYCFGIRCPRNFRAPFAAVDIKDFWNRWHITLSTWLRDFVFMRFTRMAIQRRLFPDRLRTACAGYLVNMVLMGAWHGLTPDYLAYGLYHGLLLAGNEVYQKRSGFHKRHRRDLWYRALSWFITLQLVIFGFALFSGQLHTIVERMING